jgi:hypothetical protein
MGTIKQGKVSKYLAGIAIFAVYFLFSAIFRAVSLVTGKDAMKRKTDKGCGSYWENL